MSVLKFAGGLTMLAGIVVLTFTIYVLTGRAHFLSIPGTAILACAVMLLFRDEWLQITEVIVWDYVQSPILRMCVNQSIDSEDGWLIPADKFTTYRNPLTWVKDRLFSYQSPVRVLKYNSDDGESCIVGWTLKPIYIAEGSEWVSFQGKNRRFSKRTF